MCTRVLLMLAVLGAVVAGCSVVDDKGGVERIDPPFGLDDTLAPTTTVAATTTELATTTTGLVTTTTQVQTEPVRLYFIASGQLTYVLTGLPSPVALPQLIAALQKGPPSGDLGAGLRSAVPPARVAEIRVTTDGSGVVQVILPDGFFDAVTVGTDQRLVIAQLVLTLTDSRGVGQVMFNIAVPLPSGEQKPAGEPLSYRDYQLLAGSNPASAEVDTTTTSASPTPASSTTAPSP